MHKKPVLIIIILLLLLSFISCTPKTKDEAEIEIKPEDIFGTWTSETTYENEQLGMKFALDGGYSAMNEEEINEFTAPRKNDNERSQTKPMQRMSGRYQYFDFG